MSNSTVTLKNKLGCWIRERLMTEIILNYPFFTDILGLSWLDLCNRSEQLVIDPVTGGRICQWQFSSQLTVARLFPEVGLRLLNFVLKKYPVHLNFETTSNISKNPKCSILFVIGGVERIPQFELALASARAQVNIDYEIIVVEQSPESLFRGILPADVRYFHQVNDLSQKGFNKSWALNKAAEEAKGENLIILDADFLIPACYTLECDQKLKQIDGIRPGRLLFYLNKLSTLALFNSKNLSAISGLDGVISNTPLPIATGHKSYWDIGGHDEAFWGWGGEDTEFLDRLRTLNIAEGGWLPIIHLWHPAAPKKANGDRNDRLYHDKTQIPPGDRIKLLKKIINIYDSDV